MRERPDFFSANAAAYDRSRPSLVSDSTRDALVRIAALRSGGRILDMAAGTGRIAIPFARAGYRVVAVDRSQEMLNVMRGKAPGKTVDAVVASAASLPFGTRTFDALVIARLLYLTPDWRRFLSKRCAY